MNTALMEMKKFGADLPESVVDRFDQFVRSKGLLKRRAIMAALEFIRAAPPDLRDLLMSEDIKGAAAWMTSMNHSQDNNCPPAFAVDSFISAGFNSEGGASEDTLDPKKAAQELKEAGDRAIRKRGDTQSKRG